MTSLRTAVTAATLSLLSVAPLHAAPWSLSDWLRTAGDALRETPQTTEVAEQREIAAALKQALSQGSRAAIEMLGRTDGFAANPAAHIPLPQTLATLEPRLRQFGLGGLLDDFELRLNRAAEAAIPETAEIFAQAVGALTINDALGILNGPDDAATQYFERTTSEELTARIRPLVAEATASAGVTRAYKDLAGTAGPLLGAWTGTSGDLDDYVTREAITALFGELARQEKLIRDDPAARTTDLLRRVFGRDNG